MNLLIERCTVKATQELKDLISDSRAILLEAVTEKVGKLSHAEEREVLALVLTPTNEKETAYVAKRTKLLIDSLIDNALTNPRVEVKEETRKEIFKEGAKANNRPAKRDNKDAK